jgi:hypothetical protein
MLTPKAVDGTRSLWGTVAKLGESHALSREIRSSGLDDGVAGYILNSPNWFGSVRTGRSCGSKDSGPIGGVLSREGSELTTVGGVL